MTSQIKLTVDTPEPSKHETKSTSPAVPADPASALADSSAFSSAPADPASALADSSALSSGPADPASALADSSALSSAPADPASALADSSALSSAPADPASALSLLLAFLLVLKRCRSLYAVLLRTKQCGYWRW